MQQGLLSGEMGEENFTLNFKRPPLPIPQPLLLAACKAQPCVQPFGTIISRARISPHPCPMTKDPPAASVCRPNMKQMKGLLRPLGASSDIERSNICIGIEGDTKEPAQTLQPLAQRHRCDPGSVIGQAIAHAFQSQHPNPPFGSLLELQSHIT